MADSDLPSFLVDVLSDPIAIRIQGRASFQNSAAIKAFFAEMLGLGKRRFVMDFALCTSMDSTFLGVLAGAALQLRKVEPRGSLVLCRLSPRNSELVRNLGLNRLLTLDTDTAEVELKDGARAVSGEKLDELTSARLVLEAHENLVEADGANHEKFEDVLAFLKGRLNEG
jgi:anti-anti-sigma factor